MATVNQLIRKPRKPKSRKTDVPALVNSPQKEEFAHVFILLPLRNQILL